MGNSTVFGAVDGSHIPIPYALKLFADETFAVGGFHKNFWFLFSRMHVVTMFIQTYIYTPYL